MGRMFVRSMKFKGAFIKSSGARAHGGPASRPYRPPVTAHVRQTTIRVRVEKKIGRREGTQTHRLSTAKLYSGKPGLRGSDATSGRWQVRQGSSSRTNLRRPIRAGKRRPKSYAGAEAIIAQAMAQGMAGRMHGRMAGAAPMPDSQQPCHLSIHGSAA